MSRWQTNPEVIRRLTKALNRGVTNAAMVAATQAERSFGSDHGGVPSSPGSPPNSQTGHLRNSIAFASPESLGTPGHAAFGTSVEYGRHLEFGAVVRPRKVRYLPVPVNKAAKDMLRRLKGASLRSQNLKFIKYRNGTKMLREVTPAKGKLKKDGAAFALKLVVVILARPWLARASRDAKHEMADAFAMTVKRELGV